MWRAADLVNFRFRWREICDITWRNFVGQDYVFQESWREHSDLIRGDRLTSFFLGLLELLVYPILIALQAWLLIGSWVGLKTL